ncbi:MAG: 5-bromo-4-chloroindolyl phosphate hydrolysis family protein [Rhodospirillales bacterium]|nr:5-bromo-4-chloroindolyl phosphate hydrolysis family protein [Rhodospirillales bacterium]
MTQTAGRNLRARGFWPGVLTLLFAFSSLIRLVGGDVTGFGLGIGLTAILGAGTWSLRRGLDYRRGEGGFPGRTLGAGLIALATGGMAAALADHGFVESGILALAAGAGTIMAYGSELLERKPRRKTPARLDRSQAGEAQRLIAEARAKRDRLIGARHRLRSTTGGPLRDRIGRMAAAADGMLDAVGQDRKELRGTRKALAGYILGQRIDRVVALTDRILDRIREDPRDLRRARKFMQVYLDGAAQAAERLVRLQSNDEAAAARIAPRMVALLAAMERAAEELHQKLLANDTLDLDVQMEVLEQRIHREGLS